MHTLFCEGLLHRDASYMSIYTAHPCGPADTEVYAFCTKLLWVWNDMRVK